MYVLFSCLLPVALSSIPQRIALLRRGVSLSKNTPEAFVAIPDHITTPSSNDRSDFDRRLVDLFSAFSSLQVTPVNDVVEAVVTQQARGELLPVATECKRAFCRYSTIEEEISGVDCNLATFVNRVFPINFGVIALIAEVYSRGDHGELSILKRAYTHLLVLQALLIPLVISGRLRVSPDHSSCELHALLGVFLFLDIRLM